MYGNYYSSEPSLMESMKELYLEGMKKNIYILMSNGEIRAATTKSDIEKHLVSEDSIIRVTDLEDDQTMLLHGLLLDPASLPYEIPPAQMTNRKLYLIVESGVEVDCESYEEMEEVTDAIADLMDVNGELEITDIAVLLGSQIDFVLAPAKSGDPVSLYQVLGER